MPELYQHVTANHRMLEPYDFTREILLQAYLIENTEILNFNIDQFGSANFLADEVQVKRSSNISGDGRVDILVEYEEGFLGVLELKKNKLVHKDLDQLMAYLTKENLQKISENETVKECRNPESKNNHVGILVGPSIDPSLAAEILTGIETDSGVPIAAIVIKRYRSDKDIFVISEAYYLETKGKKDYTKYILDGDTSKSYGKGRLVLAVVKKFANENPHISIEDFVKVFEIKSPKIDHVIIREAEALKIKNASKAKTARHFLNSTITLNDGSSLAVNSQWGKDNIKDFIRFARTKLNYDIKEIK